VKTGTVVKKLQTLMATEIPHFKVVLLGNSGVGKTALVERISDDIFQNSHAPTVGAQFIALELQLGGKPCVLELWDTAGQEVFRSLVGFYARDSKGAFILFDVTAAKSFQDLPMWVEFIGENAPDAKIILFGNKTDLAERQVSKQDGMKFAEKNRMVYYEGSAKTGETVSEAFDRMSEIVAASCQTAQKSVEIKADAKKSKKGCC
jgi:small GTP-binding protein